MAVLTAPVQKEEYFMKMVTINMKQMESQKEVCELLKRELDFPDDLRGAWMSCMPSCWVWRRIPVWR